MPHPTPTTSQTNSFVNETFAHKENITFSTVGQWTVCAFYSANPKGNWTTLGTFTVVDPDAVIEEPATGFEGALAGVPTPIPTPSLALTLHTSRPGRARHHLLGCLLSATVCVRFRTVCWPCQPTALAPPAQESDCWPRNAVQGPAANAGAVPRIGVCRDSLVWFPPAGYAALTHI